MQKDECQFKKIFITYSQILLCIAVNFTVVDQLMEQNFPMSIDRVADPTACWLVQDGYITLYSPKRKSPIFTSERLEEDILQKV